LRRKVTVGNFLTQELTALLYNYFDVTIVDYQAGKNQTITDI